VEAEVDGWAYVPESFVGREIEVGSGHTRGRMDVGEGEQLETEPDDELREKVRGVQLQESKCLLVEQ
jgi:hypothetical protein